MLMSILYQSLQRRWGTHCSGPEANGASQCQGPCCSSAPALPRRWKDLLIKKSPLTQDRSKCREATGNGPEDQQWISLSSTERCLVGNASGCTCFHLIGGECVFRQAGWQGGTESLIPWAGKGAWAQWLCAHTCACLYAQTCM